MMQDIVGAMRAMVGFACLFFAPGYVLASAINLFGFRKLNFLARIASAVVLSFAVSPVFAILLGRVVPLGAVAVGVGAVGCIALVLILAGHRKLTLPVNRDTIALAAFLVFGILVIVGSLVDIQVGNRLYFSVSVLDQAYRVAFTNGIAHSGIPPQNPLYHPGAASPMRYYYFWYALCAVCMKLAHVTARQALMASSCWAGIGLTAMISVYARYFLQVKDRLYRFILVAMLLLTITGLDILPVLYNLFVHHDFSGDLEWWSADQVASWFDTILWVPNHLAALLCCLAAFLLLWRARSSSTRRDQLSATILAGIAAASAFGLSIYVTAGFAMLMALWCVNLLIRQRDKSAVIRNLGTVALATALLLPYLRDLVGAHSGTESGANAGAGHIFQFGVRKMIDSGLITGLPALAGLNQGHPVLLDQLVRLCLLVPGYALELGFYGLVLILAIRARKSLDPAYATALWLSVGGLVLVSFVRSAVIGNNDFGYRAALIPSFFLLLLAAERMTSASSKGWLTLLLLFGLAGSGFQAAMLRAYVPLHVAARMPGFDGLPEEAFAIRTEYAEAASLIPDSAVVQSNLIDPANYFYVANMLYSERAMVTDAAIDCGAVFGGNPALCAETQRAVRELFATPTISATKARVRCNALGIDYLAVSRGDPAWNDKNGWVWAFSPVLSDRNSQKDADQTKDKRFRVVQCGTASGSPP